jgi:parallel beta-helix repeat protein
MSTASRSLADNDLDYGPTLRGLRAGQRMFGQRYQLVRQLGRGGMGVVWLAQDARLDRGVALKFLPESVQGDPAAIDELKRETRRCLELTHPNIVRIFDFEQGDETAAIAMEYIEGQTLSELRLTRPNRVFEAGDILPWVQTAIAALSHAHTECKMVHRDLKPANFMLDNEGHLKLADFGIACRISDSFSRLSRGAVSAGAGTLVYMSPQQLMGFPPKVTDDVYSLGATIYELLTGKPPFHSGSIERQIEAVVPPSMTQRRSELEIESSAAIPETWEKAVASCLEKEPGKRPQSMEAVLEQVLGRSTAASQANKTAQPVLPPLPEQASKPSASTARLKASGERGGSQSWLGIAAVLFLAGLAWASYHFGYVLPHEQEMKRIAEEQRAAEVRLQKEKDDAERLTREKDAELKRQQLAEKDARDKQMALQAELDRKQREEAEAQRQKMAAEEQRRMEDAKKPKVLKVPGDYSTITAAMDAARSIDTILVARGIYEECVSLKGGVELRGEDRDGTIIRNRIAENVVIQCESLSSGSVSNLTIEQKLNQSDESRYSAVFVRNSSVTIDNCHITCLSAHGISISQSGRTLISNCLIEKCNWSAVYVWESTGNPQLRNNSCDNNIGSAINISSGIDVIVSGNKCQGNKGAGIIVHAATANVESNTCSGNSGAGIYIYNGAKCLVKNNRCDNNNNGFAFQGRETKVRISGNHAHNNLYFGIAVEKICTPESFDGNSASGNNKEDIARNVVWK